MRRQLTLNFATAILACLASCTKPSDAADAQSTSPSQTPAAADSQSPAAAQPLAGAGPAAKPGAGLVAEPPGVEGTLSITIRWSSEIVQGDDNIGKTTTVYKRLAQLECPITSSDEAPYSYFASTDNPAADPFARTGSYQPWWNEECSGTLTVNDTYHADDPTLAGPEPVVKTTGTKALSTGDTPLTVEIDLNRGRTRYYFLSPSAYGFQQEAAEGYEAKLVAASAAPMAVMDFTLEGPIGDGKREVAVQGGKLNVDWTFTRERNAK